MLELFNNKTAFLKKEPQIGWILILLIILILLCLLKFTCQKEIYDSYQTKGIVTCSDTCLITTAIPTTLNFEKLAMNHQNLDYEVISKELKIDEENYQTFYEITLSVKKDLTNHEVVDLNFYYNKQRIITKIKDKMF